MWKNDGIQSNCEISFKDGFSNSKIAVNFGKQLYYYAQWWKINFVIQWNEFNIYKLNIWLSIDPRYHIEMKWTDICCII